ncbi:MAG TPA: hypothetical protein VFT84_10360 [Gemmatimonadales bacterium]|nr:hypothetical protein [Gemmatimonadales bacterium]
MVAVFLAAAAAAALQWGPARLARWRADRTADRFVDALHRADSAALSRLTPGGKTRGILCARRLWPAAYWSRGGGAPPVERMPSGMDYRYRVVGDTLVERKAPAELEFFIVADRPGEVDRYFADLRGTSWSEPFRVCLHGG